MQLLIIVDFQQENLMIDDMKSFLILSCVFARTHSIHKILNSIDTQ